MNVTNDNPIMIAMCTGDHVHAATAQSLTNMIAMLHYRKVPHGVAWFHAPISVSRNVAAEAAMQTDSSYLLFIDSDMSFPTSALERLLSHGVDIVGPSYLGRHSPRRMNHLLLDGTFADPPGVMTKVDYVATGFLLIKTEIFKKIPFPWFNFEHHAPSGPKAYTGEDVYFCRKARQHGFDVWLDWELTHHMRHHGVVPLGYHEREI